MSKRPAPSSTTSSYADCLSERRPAKAIKPDPDATAQMPTPGQHGAPAVVSGGCFSYKDSAGNHHPTFSFDDGLVILKTRGDSPSLFKVSRSLLSRQSQVLRDILSSPHLEKLSLYEGGLPVIEVGHYPVNLQLFLNALHYPWEYFNDPQWKLPKSVCALLVLSTTYGVAEMRRRMLDHLTGLYPSSLDKFDHRVRPETKVNFVYLDVARKVKATHLIPAIFYSCIASTTTAQICLAPTTLTEACFFSDPQDKAICLAGRQAIICQTMVFLHAMGDHNFVCGGKCAKTISLWVKSAIDLPEGLPRLLLDSGRVISMLASESAICPRCVHHIDVVATKARADLWQSLPGIFGLPDWKTLLQDENI